mgnify:CR=1 FL=1
MNVLTGEKLRELRGRGVEITRQMEIPLVAYTGDTAPGEFLVRDYTRKGFLRGTAEHLPVWDWLTQHINPMHRMLRAEEAEAAIEKALGVDQLKLITTGGDTFEAEREQWNDANNVLTVRPGVVVGYERNTYTNEKYDKAGITVLSIPGEELGRGRGGARCMSCPMERDGI